MKSPLQILGLSTILISHYTFADVFKIGDSTKNYGSLQLNSAIAGTYIHKNYYDQKREGQKNGSFNFSSFRLILKYENPYFLGSLDTRCYQENHLCDLIYIREAWLGYKITEQSVLSIGQQDVDFGFGRLWGDSSFGTLFGPMGMENVQNLGIKYKLKHDNNSLTVGFYPTSGGNYKGTSKDSSRYSANFVEADNLKQGTHIKEKDMLITRISKEINLNSEYNFKTEIGASYWHSSLDNQITNKTGKRNTWNIFSTTHYKNWKLFALFGQQKINNADDFKSNESTFGAFDSSYQVANNGQYVMTEINYSFKEPFKNISEIKPYITYSKYLKDQANYIDSDRLILGSVLQYKNLELAGEYIISHNDSDIGGNKDALAQGENKKSNKMFIVSATYYF